MCAYVRLCAVMCTKKCHSPPRLLAVPPQLLLQGRAAPQCGAWVPLPVLVFALVLVLVSQFVVLRNSDTAKAAVTPGVLFERFKKLRLAEIRPERLCHHEFSIGNLPEQEIADAQLAAGADEQIRVGHVLRI